MSTDKTFEQIRSSFPHYTAVDDNRQRLIYDLVKQTSHLGHKMAEVGVYKGGTSHLIANTDPSRTLYACDSFEGLPAPSSVDTYHSKGDFKDVDYEAVKKLLDYPQVEVIKGFFPDILLHAIMYTRKYSFVHIDVDLYKPTLDCLNFFYYRTVTGGIIVSDDYTMSSTPGVKQAFDEFMKDKKETLIDSGHKSCYFIKE